MLEFQLVMFVGGMTRNDNSVESVWKCSGSSLFVDHHKHELELLYEAKSIFIDISRASISLVMDIDNVCWGLCDSYKKKWNKKLIFV